MFGPLRSRSDGRRADCATRRSISRPSFAGSSTTAGSGASGLAARRACPRDQAPAPIPRAPDGYQTTPNFRGSPSYGARSVGPASMSMGSCDDRISGSVMACHSAACTDDRARRMGLIYTTADWQGQICDGFRQPHIRPTQRSLEGASELLACHLAFPVIGGLRIAPCGTRPCST